MNTDPLVSKCKSLTTKLCILLEELHVILASDDGRKKVFPDVPMIGFKNNKNLKAQLVR